MRPAYPSRVLLVCSIAPSETSVSTPAKPSPAPEAEALATWAAASKLELTTLTLTDDLERSVRGMTTREARHQSDTLASVPSRLAIQVTSLDKKRSPCRDYVTDEAWRSAPWYARLAVKLLIERRKGEDSPASGYISALPQNFDEMPFHWVEAELAKLQSIRMTQAVHEQRKTYRRIYDALVADVTGKPWINYDEFVWAVECVRSRSFAGELEVASFKERSKLFVFVGALAAASAIYGTVSAADAANGALTAIFALAMYDLLTPRILGAMQGVRLKRYALVPGVDFINHASRVNGRAEVSFEYFQEKFQVSCGEDYSAGDEVAISYGAQSNDSFVQYYGFVEELNPADDYVFDDSISDLMNVTKRTLKARRGFGFENSVVEEVAKRFGGNTSSARKVLGDLCRAELDGFATSIAEDEQLLAISLSSREQLAIAYRLEKKRVLEAASNAMDCVVAAK
jgi:hypothetical protein